MINILGLIVMFNPTNSQISKMVKVPLYYTGLTKTALISYPSDDQHWMKTMLSRDYTINLRVNLEGQSLAFYIVK